MSQCPSGASSEKAARIANASANQGKRQVSQHGGKAGAYVSMTKQELDERAKKVGSDGRSSMSKPQLITALRNH